MGTSELHTQRGTNKLHPHFVLVQEYRRIFFLQLLYPANSQIWLNYFLDGHQFGYVKIIILKKKEFVKLQRTRDFFFLNSALGQLAIKHKNI